MEPICPAPVAWDEATSFGCRGVPPSGGLTAQAAGTIAKKSKVPGGCGILSTVALWSYENAGRALMGFIGGG